ncbi:MAG: nucleoside monophosphate kinase [Patescibacteria group bacterium]|nr:nucleoside monophosphate kinase [Patescibacteria group bacterium]
MKKAIMLFGPPGAGKGTQANLLAAKFGMIHFDTGRYLEQLVHDPTLQSDPEIGKARKIFDDGILFDPAFVLKIITRKAREISGSGFGIVFSGSPRTVYEAFGDADHQGLIALLESEYGRENVLPVFLDIDPKESIARNRNRKICSVCGTALLYDDVTTHKTCPLCGGELRTRTLDNPAVGETRIKEYRERTEPIFALLEKQGYALTRINGHPLPYQVFAEIKEKLHLGLA